MINTIKHLSYILKSSPEELNKVIQNIDRYYYEKVEIKLNKDGSQKLDGKGNPKKRILNPSIGKLKHIQQMILLHILDGIKLPDYAYGAIKGRDNVMNAKRHQGKKYIFTTDLKNFFPTITHRMAFEMYRSLNFSPTVSRILTQLTTYKGLLPQGAPTSPMMANLVFIKTGDKLDALSKQHKITFTTFIDDMTFSSAKDFKVLTSSFLAIITIDGFRISHNKTNYKTKNPVVTGAVVKNNNLSLTNSFKLKMNNTAGLSANQIAGIQQYANKVKAANKYLTVESVPHRHP